MTKIQYRGLLVFAFICSAYLFADYPSLALDKIDKCDEIKDATPFIVDEQNKLYITHESNNSQNPILFVYLKNQGGCRLVLNTQGSSIDFIKNSRSKFPDIEASWHVGADKSVSFVYIWNENSYISRDAQDSERLNKEALEHFRKNDLDGAIQIWEKAKKLSITPGLGLTSNAEVLNNLGFAYYKLAKKTESERYYKLARQNLDESTEVDPLRWQAYLNLGDLYAEQGDAEGAAQNYEKVLELNPNYKNAESIRNKIAALTQVNRKEILLSSMDRVAIGKGAPLLSFKLFGNTERHTLDSIGIYNENTRKEIQTVNIADLDVAEEPTDIEFEDINFDGYLDLKIRVFAGATGNEGFSYLLYNPKTGTFIRSDDFAELDRPRLIPDKKQFITYRNQGSAGAEFAENTYELRNNKPILIRSTTQRYIHEKGYLLRTEKELINGKLTVVRESQVDE
jgi:tetratricopeptide (TPR) repeat protein